MVCVSLFSAVAAGGGAPECAPQAAVDQRSTCCAAPRHRCCAGDHPGRTGPSAAAAGKQRSETLRLSRALCCSASKDLLFWGLFCSGKDEESEKDSQSSLGEGGETGELVPGKSLVYATMELLVFILVRHLPQLNSRVKESPSHVPLRPQRLSEESARLVANTVSILAELPLLCSAAGETCHSVWC